MGLKVVIQKQLMEGLRINLLNQESKMKVEKTISEDGYITIKIDDVEFVDASVGSSWIDRFEYNHGSKKLTVVTQDDRVYTYIGVPVDLWNDLIVNTNTGDSAGMFYNEWIKGKYELA